MASKVQWQTGGRIVLVSALVLICSSVDLMILLKRLSDKRLADIDHQISNRSLKGHKALLLQCYLYHLQRFF